MSEEISEESLPADVSIGLNSLSIENSSEAATKEEDSKGVKQKVVVLLKATGNAPIIKKQRWAVDPEKPVGWIIEFIRNFLKLDASEKLFLYVNQTFAPSPDQLVKNLYECFGTNGKVVSPTPNPQCEWRAALMVYVARDLDVLGVADQWESVAQDRMAPKDIAQEAKTLQELYGHQK